MSSMSSSNMAMQQPAGMQPPMNKQYVTNAPTTVYQTPSQQMAASAASAQHHQSRFLLLFYAMRIVGILALIAIIVIIIIAIHNISTLPTATDDWTVILALVFNLLLALLLIIAMLEWRFILRHVAVLGSWVFLGLTQCYLAVQVASTVNGGDLFGDEVRYGIRGCSLTLFIVGFLFVILGVIGGKGMRKRREADAEKQRRIEAGLPPGSSDDDMGV